MQALFETYEAGALLCNVQLLGAAVYGNLFVCYIQATRLLMWHDYL